MLFTSSGLASGVFAVVFADCGEADGVADDCACDINDPLIKAKTARACVNFMDTHLESDFDKEKSRTEARD
jgi:hypothetical protein